MILKRITLENFGNYKGQQEALLEPSKTKPVILFGGMNGGGKTTFLDAIQLVLYGKRARLSNRGNMGYTHYLAESIHRSDPPILNASITLEFSREIDGCTKHFVVKRAWKNQNGRISESLALTVDGKEDSILSENWDEFIDSYLPASISHLFFFDGEQIKELAEGKRTSEILEKAINALLGLDLVDTLENDLKVLERRKRKDIASTDDAEEISFLESELTEIAKKIDQLVQTEGQTNNQVTLTNKKLNNAISQFRSKGGETYEKRDQLKATHQQYQEEILAHRAKLRVLAAEKLPLILISNLLKKAATVSKQDNETMEAKHSLKTIRARDKELVKLLDDAMQSDSLPKVHNFLNESLKELSEKAGRAIQLGMPTSFNNQLELMLASEVEPQQKDALNTLNKLELLLEKNASVERELERIPPTDKIAALQTEVTALEKELARLTEKLKQQATEKNVLQSLRQRTESKLESLQLANLKQKSQSDMSARLLAHSTRSRKTLKTFRQKVVQKHAASLELLMIEAFNTLIGKESLVRKIRINPETYEVTLLQPGDKPLPFDRLSAGERQLLATSILWALARASGRPVPTIIDTPLSRLDSTHRKNLVEHYFPAASHQVLLLSTDEEIIGDYHHSLQKHVQRAMTLSHNKQERRTEIIEGYFPC